MPNYKQMYLKMVRATEQAQRILIQAQQDCEQLYISSSEPELRLLSQVEEEQKQSVGRG